MKRLLPPILAVLLTLSAVASAAPSAPVKVAPAVPVAEQYPWKGTAVEGVNLSMLRDLQAYESEGTVMGAGGEVLTEESLLSEIRANVDKGDAAMRSLVPKINRRMRSLFGLDAKVDAAGGVTLPEGSAVTGYVSYSAMKNPPKMASGITPAGGCYMTVAHAVTSTIGHLIVRHIVTCSWWTSFTVEYTGTAAILESWDENTIVNFSKAVEAPPLLTREVSTQNLDLTTQPYAFTYTGDTTVPGWNPVSTWGFSRASNKVGEIYPVYKAAERIMPVWFPPGSYNPPGTADYDQFSNNCHDWYIFNRVRWVDGGGRQNHHVRPVRWGGDDSGANCYRLLPAPHTSFTNWWGIGNQKFSTPESN